MNRERNRFELVESHMHLTEKNKFVFRGIYSQNKRERSLVTLWVDDLPIPLEEEVRQGVDVRRRYGNFPYPIDTEHLFSCVFPDDIERCRKLEIIEFSYYGKLKLYQVSVKKLLKSQRTLRYAIESVREADGSVEVAGWYIDYKNVKIGVLGQEGRMIYPEVKYGYRRDVLEAFPEASPEKVKGFRFSYPSTGSPYARICFQYGNKVVKEAIALHPPKAKVYGQAAARNVKKAYAYYKRHGFWCMVDRAKEKLFDQEEEAYARWLRKNMPDEMGLDKQRKRRFAKEPKISIVVPLYKTPRNYLLELVKSVEGQTYYNWELCLSDGSGKDSPLTHLLKRLERSDSRIKVAYNKKQLRISENTNCAIRLSTGDYIGFADHDDLLAPNALYECVRMLEKHPEAKAIYSDEDKVDMKGKRYFQPHFKPDYNKDLLNSTNYFCHFFLVERGVLKKAGGLDPAFDGAQDYDFVLRCAEVTDRIFHIPKILYHWRAHMDSTAENPASKMYAFEAGARAIQAHYNRIGWDNTKVTQTECLGVYRTHYKLRETPLVSIIIPNKDHVEDLSKCLDSLSRCSYQNYEILVVENNSQNQDTFAYYEEIQEKDSRIQVLYWKEAFNYSSINNFGVTHAKGQYLLFLNNDTEVINEDCLEELLGFCMRPDVGVVGARLYFGDGTIQHAGVVVGLGGIAGHIFSGTPRDQVGYFARVVTQQDYSAVTAACMMVERESFDRVGGFDGQLQVAFNDIDLCLRIRGLGKLVVYNPYAELFHYESKSRGSDDTPEKSERFNRETAYFEQRWKQILTDGDPYYNRNFAIDRFDCSLK